MTAAVSMISAVIKSVAGEKIGIKLLRDLFGISVDEVSKEVIENIERFINEQKSELENILSKENMESMNIPQADRDYVVAEIKDLFKNIEITDEIMGQCQYDVLKLRAFLWQQYCERKKDSYIECEGSIKKGLSAVAEMLIKLTESNEFEYCMKQIRNLREEIKGIDGKLDKIYGAINKNSAMKDQDGKQEKTKSRAKEYKAKWDENMFLNNFKEWDENKGENVKLKDVYIEEHLPHYVWRENKQKKADLKGLLSDYIVKDYGKYQMLLILGQPGIGKSTLITWMMANFQDRAKDILVYQFAADVKSADEFRLDYTQRRLLLGELELSFDDIDGKVLILDGFDEISVRKDREELLNQLYIGLGKANLEHNVLLIVTCRENYIQNMKKLECEYITLQPWEGNQIQSFCDIYCEKVKRSISEIEINNIIKNKDVLGIPLILYMALALDICIEEENSIVDIYDRIFSLKEEGIYERCFEDLKKNKIERYGDTHRISPIKEPVHQISREIAIWMFENNPNEAFIPQNEYQNIFSKVIGEHQLHEEEFGGQETLIGDYFKLIKHCEGVDKEELCFIHRSIYEYFVAETIFSSIEHAMNELSNESRKEFAGNIAQYLKIGELSPTIIQYLSYKLKKQYNKLDAEKQQRFYWWWESAIDKMMDVGMFYYSKPIRHKMDGVLMEARCFMNLVEILRSVPETEPRKYTVCSVNRKSLEKYIRYCAVVFSIWKQKSAFERLDLRKMDLKGLDLHAIDLMGADLAGANLSRTNLAGANLTKANLRGADLMGASLIEADLREADLREANLRKVDFRGAILEYINSPLTKSGGQKLGSANMKKACINNSIWMEKDIRKFRQFEKTIFTNFVVEDEGGNRTTRKKNEKSDKTGR